ncbi:MAG: ATP-dependent zinc metalloprotease FtsH [Synergistaceae bacterium]|jgi:cell division protease FtsH|nr:ATP-dependent zinc metalloprotease FtsH [Synergistaceae bacterium]
MEPKKKRAQFSLAYFVLMIFVVWIFNDMIYRPYMLKEREVSYSAFLKYLSEGHVKSVAIWTDRLAFTLKGEDSSPQDNPSFVHNVVRVADPGIVDRLMNAGVEFSEVKQTEGILNALMGWVIAFLPLILLWYFMYRRMSGVGGSVLSFGKNNSQEIQGEMTGVRFADVGGVGEAEVELKEIIDYLKFPERFNRLGAKLPKGVLLVGPPGTGKTLLAKATAGEAGVPFFSLTGSSFVEMFVGVGAARVRDLFEQAKKKAPCIIFIDEIDAIGQARSSIAAMSGNSERENTLNQLLAEMDGFRANTGVIIMAATNRPEILDQALVRPGRFDRQVQITLPTEEGRLGILKIHSRGVPLEDGGNLEGIARMTPGFSGAELANIINEASLLAVRRGAEKVAMRDLDLAIERVVAGLQKKTPLSPEVRRKVAFHEAGHALTACSLSGTDPVHKISIIPTSKGALGYTMQLPTEDQFLKGEDELRSRMAVMLGGRAAELLVFGTATTGASNDLEVASMLARRMVTEFGMSKTLGPVRYSNPEGAYLGSPSSNRDDISQETTAAIDREIRDIVTEAQSTAMKILETRRPALDKIALTLQENEVVMGDEMREIIDSAGAGETKAGE